MTEGDLVAKILYTIDSNTDHQFEPVRFDKYLSEKNIKILSFSSALN